MWALTLNTPIARSRVITAKRSRLICQSIVAPSHPVSASRPSEGTNTQRDFANVLGLVQWAIANKIRFTGCRPDIRNGVRGVYATVNCNTGDNLVAVPFSSCLVVLPNERCPFPDFIPQDAWSALPWYGQLACKLLYERSLGPASRFVDYLPALPTHVDLPVLWPNEHVRALQYPYLEQKIRDEKEEWRGLYDRVRRHLERRGLTRADMFWALACVRSRTFAGPHLPTPAPVKLLAGLAVAAVATAAASSSSAAVAEPAGMLMTLLPAVLTALGVPALWQMTEARRAASGEPGTVLYAVCPFIDMFNHDSGAQSECVFTPGRDEFRVSAGEPLRRGQQVLINYGNQSNDALLQRYGFVNLNGNLHDRYVLDDLRLRLERVLELQMGVPSQEVWASIRESNLPRSSLDQVVLTAVGPPQQTLQAAATIIAGLAGRRLTAPQGGILSAKALVAAACAEEQWAATSSLQEDETAWAQLERWEAWEAEVAAAAVVEEKRVAAAGAAVSIVEACVTHQAEAGARSSGIAVDMALQVIAHEQGTATGSGDFATNEGASPKHPPPAEQEFIMPPTELAAFGNDVERYRTVLMFRLAKKRLLRGLASAR